MVYILIWILLVLVSAMTFQTKTQFSAFERDRLLKKGDAAAVMEVRALEQSSYLRALQRIFVAILTIGFAAAVLAVFPGLAGVVGAMIGAICVPVFANLPLVRSLAGRIEKTSRSLLEKVVEPIKPALALWKKTNQSVKSQISSKEELVALVTGSQGLMSRAELSRFRANMRFDDQRVVDTMTGRQDISAISMSEVLGPLVLDELYKTGHSRFPVYDQDIDTIVGMLYLNDLVDLRSQQQTVEQAMRRSVLFVRDDKPLPSLLSMFLRKHQHLAIVTNDHGETVGVVSLEDVVEELIGKEILDEFDTV